MSREAGYILRISKKSWVTQVFDTAVYYTALSRNWKAGQIVLFIHKTIVGDAFIGYGVVEKTREVNEFTEDEHLQCERQGWRKAIEFKYVMKFDRPVPITATFLRNSRIRGRYLHGLKVDNRNVSLIIEQARSRNRPC